MNTFNQLWKRLINNKVSDPNREELEWRKQW
jgi:hypothetical protein